MFGKKWEHLDIVGDDMLVPYANTVHIYPVIAGNIYKAIAKYNMGQEELAVDYLRKAVEYAAPDNITIPFVENGCELRPIMNMLMPDDFLGRVLWQTDKYDRGKAAVKNGAFGDGVISNTAALLTSREAELMEYVKAGYRNAEIAQKMHIARITVEKNLTNIYRKLGVKNRTAAISMISQLKAT